MDEQGMQTTKKAAEEWTKQFSHLACDSQNLFKQLLQKHIPSAILFQMSHFNRSYLKLLQQHLSKPEQLVASQAIYWQELFIIWQRLMQEGQDHFIFHFVNEYYRLHIDYFQSLLMKAERWDEINRQLLHFNLKQLSEALVANRFVTMNPESWQLSVQAKGKKFLQDVDKILFD